MTWTTWLEAYAHRAPPATLVEADRRQEAGEPPESTALARTGLRVGAVVLCWLNMTDGRRSTVRIGTIASVAHDRRYPWYVPGSTALGGGHDRSEIWVLP